MKKQQERQPVLITNAARSPSEQLRSRQIRYVSMMAGRAACLIIGAVLISVRPPLLPLWLIMCVAGMVFLPWAAVLIANDRSPKTKAERQAARPEFHRTAARSWSGGTQAARPEFHRTMIEQQSTDEIRHRTIDADD